MRDQFGVVVGAINCFRDVTAYRKQCAAAPKENRLIHTLLDALPIAVYTTDRTGVITYYNEAAVTFWGRRPVIGEEEWCGSYRLFWSDGSPMAHHECPMAVALKEGRAVRGAEAIAERPDGSRVNFIPFPTPLFDDSGALVGAVNALVDVTDAKRDFEAEQRLIAIVESSHDAIVSKDLNGIIASWNKGAERLFGYSAHEVIGKSITILIPQDRLDEEDLILGRIRRGEAVDHYETIRRRKDGSLVDISLTVSPLRDANGKIVGASKIARDITDRRRAEEQQRLLLREMNHRVKNLFALASGVVSLSSRSAASPEQLVAAIRDRLGALSRAHDLTLPRLARDEETGPRATTLEALIRTIVSPYNLEGELESARVHLIGPDVAISGTAVTSLALLLNEFAANAAKYGAFSLPSGVVTVEWRVEGEQLDLAWVESGGPKVEHASSNEGFGSLLSRATVQGQFGGRIDREWRPEGLAIRLSVPTARLTPG
jgi:PAS domain S-box-containing protein